MEEWNAGIPDRWVGWVEPAKPITQSCLLFPDFFDRFVKGQVADLEEFVEWANDYQHYLALRHEVESRIRHAG
jgi:hypothetical protein